MVTGGASFRPLWACTRGDAAPRATLRRSRMAAIGDRRCRMRMALSPFHGPAVAEEPAARAVVGQPRGPDDATGAILDPPSAGAAHVCRDPARTHRVDQHAAAVQLRR